VAADLPWFYCPDLSGALIQLPEEEARHALSALRLKVNDVAILFDGNDLVAQATVVAIEKRGIQLVVNQVETKPSRPYQVHLAIAPTKNVDRIEWMLEKCVELGLDSLQLLQTQYGEREKIRPDRLKRIAISACKQAHQPRLPNLPEPISFDQFAKSLVGTDAQVAIAHCRNLPARKPLISLTKSPNQWILIGPEGDFTVEEIDSILTLGGQSVSLGDSRLRTETAGLAAVHTIHLLHQL
jgi:16S rRNA (uracil1498-N3)-methyltransferase